ncbi:hypothetical protein VTP01DRAFT_5249 [Rhizomucor pusillus]|uniref:uncharacterized protein n=1 Tax=Rhizomucor pusillus TaxID=4840 RepID=UPI003742A3DB
MSGPSRMLFRRVAALSVAPRTRAIGRIAVPARLPLQTSTFIEPACISSATIQYRSYAKKANKKKNTTAATAAEDNGQEVAKAFDEDKVKEKMDNIVKSLKEHYASMRVGRANPALLDGVRVKIDGSMYPLRDLAQVTIKDAQTLLVAVHDPDFRSDVDKSIREAGLNLNPVIDNEMIRVPIPKPTKDSKDKMAKSVAQMGEQAKSKLRNVRQDGMKALKQDAKHESADVIKKLEKLVQNMVDSHNKAIDELIKSKTKEIQS